MNKDSERKIRKAIRKQREAWDALHELTEEEWKEMMNRDWFGFSVQSK